MDDQYRFEHYMIRKKVFKLLGEAFHIYDPEGNVVFYSKLKAFKLKEDIRVYSGEDMETELLTIQARQILDFAAAYDVVDTQRNMKVGALKRKGLKSLFQDEWLLMDPDDREAGKIEEDQTALALARRFIPYANLIPQTFNATLNGIPVVTYKRHFNPFVLRMDIDFAPPQAVRIDRRLGIAAGVLLAAIEGRQS
jgi:hypothetical protein